MEQKSEASREIRINYGNRGGFASGEIKQGKKTAENAVKANQTQKTEEKPTQVAAAAQTVKVEDSVESAFKTFSEKYPDKGYIRVQAFTARRSFPVEGARVIISKDFPEGEYILADFVTDSSGMTDTAIVPAQKKELSQSPGTTNPYTSYNVRVDHPDYVPEFYKDIPVFQDIVSLQIADLLPKSLEYKEGETIEFNEENQTRVE